MTITTYKCDRCGREIPSTKVIRLVVDRPIWGDCGCKILKDGLNMDLCIYCFGDLTKTPIDDFIPNFSF